LYCEYAVTARGVDDQNPLSGLHLADIAQRMQRRER
jgi:hypothetical protein